MSDSHAAKGEAKTALDRCRELFRICEPERGTGDWTTLSGSPNVREYLDTIPADSPEQIARLEAKLAAIEEVCDPKDGRPADEQLEDLLGYMDVLTDAINAAGVGDVARALDEPRAVAEAIDILAKRGRDNVDEIARLKRELYEANVAGARVTEAYRALRDRTPLGRRDAAVDSYEIADWPYPPDWDAQQEYMRSLECERDELKQECEELHKLVDREQNALAGVSIGNESVADWQRCAEKAAAERDELKETLSLRRKRVAWHRDRAGRATRERDEAQTLYRAERELRKKAELERDEALGLRCYDCRERHHLLRRGEREEIIRVTRERAKAERGEALALLKNAQAEGNEAVAGQVAMVEGLHIIEDHDEDGIVDPTRAKALGLPKSLSGYYSAAGIAGYVLARFTPEADRNLRIVKAAEDLQVFIDSHDPGDRGTMSTFGAHDRVQAVCKAVRGEKSDG